MDAALGLVDELDSLGDDRKAAAYPVLSALLRNIYSNPNEMKFRTVKKSNKRIQTAICNENGQVHPQVMAVLQGCGFEDGIDGLVYRDGADLEVLGAVAELLEAMHASLGAVAPAAPPPVVPSGYPQAGTALGAGKPASAGPAGAVPGFRRREADPVDKAAADLASARAEQAAAFQNKPAAAAPRATPASGTLAPAAPASAGPAGKKMESAFEFKRRVDVEKEEAKAADDLNSLRAAQRAKFDKGKADGTAYQGEAYNKPASVAPGGYEESSFWSSMNPANWFGGSSGPAPNSGGGRPRDDPDRPRGARMKTLNDLPKPCKPSG